MPAQCVAARHSPFASLRDTLTRWINASGEKNTEDAADLISGWFDGTDMADSLHVNVLQSLLEDRLEDGTAGRQAVFAACAALVERFPRPMIIVIEDAHWIDASTLG